ncbi:facilitated trehalose transporter Tret1 isoform X1 [Nasonia vitripennis]|uniref:Major facilitator superfamily (MFS) profile domain-containing protein n=2 Tax=Nasonia vitripennis TaxID=7425 RepID=A0A7M7G641_NASVI|nr:facilitated trehalose transporter Tret1 isoform X1 [Nasonia vitripennis]
MSGLGPSDALLNGTKEAATRQEMEPAGMPRPKGQRTQWKQWAACISATLSMVAAGTVYGWSTTIQTRLTDNTTVDVPIHVTGEQSSWIISLVVIGSMMGAFYGAYVAASCGRKICLLMSSLFYILGWLLVIFAHNVWYLYISRLILGIGVGMSYTANPMYVSEVADVNIRGALSTLIAVNVFTGSLISCSVGPWTTYLTLGIALLCIPILFVLTFAWFPESPYYLLSKGKSAEAASAIAFFQGITDPDELRQEVELVRRNIGKDSSDEFEELKFSFSDFLLLMKTRNRRALVIVMGLILGQQLSGSFTTMQYLEMMFHDAKIGIDSHTATIIVLVVAMVSGGVSTMTVEGAGRRLLLLYSSFACALSLGVLGVYLLIKSTGADLSSINLLPVFDIIVFQAVYQIGLGTMPNLLIGELFPTNVKGIAGAVIIVFDGLMGFIVSKYYEPIFIRLGGQVVYLFFCVSTLGIFFFIYAYVPETKRKTFLEIQDILDELRPFKVHSSTSISCLPIKRSGGEEDNKTEEA